ncbi:hypothetical protein D3C72_1517260 [compost metagenome]
MSRPAMPGSQMILSSPSMRLSSASASALLTPGLRFLLSTQLSVMIAVPWPSTSMPPPSITRLLRSSGTPVSSAMRAATVASRAWACWLPQPLKLKFTAARSPRALRTKTQPVSRIQRSSMACSIRCTLEPHSWRAVEASAGFTSILTGS